MSNIILFSLIIVFICGAIHKKINAYDAFIDGAKEGFQTAITIIPYLVAMLVAIGVFRASCALDLLADGARAIVHFFKMDDRFVDALPTALMKPFSGRGARADDDRHDESPRRRFLRRTLIVYRPRQHGNHVLRADDLLRLSRHQAHPPRRHLWDNSRSWRYNRCYFCGLLVFWLSIVSTFFDCGCSWFEKLTKNGFLDFIIRSS